MAPGTLSQGGRRGAWAASQASTARPQGERPSESKGAVSAVDASADTGRCVAAWGLRETNLHPAFRVRAASGACSLSPWSIFYTLGAHTHPCIFCVCEGPVFVTCRSPPPGQSDLKTSVASVRLHASASHCRSWSSCPGRDTSE